MPGTRPHHDKHTFPESWQMTWKHQRSKHAHLLDYILTRRRDRKEAILSTRVLRVADCSTHHYMARSACKLNIKPIQRKKRPQAPKKLNVPSEKNPTTLQERSCNITNQLQELNLTGSLEEKWTTLRTAVYSEAFRALGGNYTQACGLV